ncbi:MAG: PEP-CTERM sorting domain-containing protein [Thermoguttaceae bacterium]|jgi:hypothetical protein
MKTTVKTISLKMIILFSVAAMMLAAGVALADTLVDRGLPTANLNNAAGANRSNVSCAEPTSNIFDGDTFTVQGTQTWKVDTISLWVVGEDANNNSNLTDDAYLGDTYNNLSLYVGTGGNLTRVSLASFMSGTDTTSNPNVVGTRVQYNNGAGTELDYQGSSGHYWTIVQLDFNNLNLYFAPGTTVQFGMYAAGGDLTYTHASDAALSGSTQDQADGLFSRFVLDSPTAAHFLDAQNGQALWGKPTDINVQVLGSVVPEPGTLTLLTLAGLSGLAMMWIRRRRLSG